MRIDRPHPQPRKIRIRVQTNFTPFGGAPSSFVKPARGVRGVNLRDAKLSAWGVNPLHALAGQPACPSNTTISKPSVVIIAFLQGIRTPRLRTTLPPPTRT